MTGWEPKGVIKEPPKAFSDWMKNNSDRLEATAGRGTTPYFIANNPKYTGANWGKQQTYPSNTKSFKILEPPHSEDYRTYIKGKVMVSPLHSTSELKENLKLGNTLNQAINSEVYLLPTIDPNERGADMLRKEYLPAETKNNKNPDFMGDGKLWDGKTASFENTPNERRKVKATIENHIKKAKEQADNFIIEIPEWVNQKWVDETVVNYLNRSNKQREIIIKRTDGSYKKYKK